MLSFEIEDFDAAAARLTQYGAVMDGDVKEDGDVKLAAFRSVDGVMLSLVQIKKSAADQKLLGAVSSITSFFKKDEEDYTPSSKEKTKNLDEIKQILRNIKL